MFPQQSQNNNYDCSKGTRTILQACCITFVVLPIIGMVVMMAVNIIVMMEVVVVMVGGGGSGDGGCGGGRRCRWSWMWPWRGWWQ